MFGKFLVLVASLIEHWKDLKLVWKNVNRKAKKVGGKYKVKLPKDTWMQRMWAALLHSLMLVPVADFFVSLISRGSGLGFLAFAKVAPGHAADVVAWAATQIVNFEPLAADLAGETMSQIIGAKVKPAKPDPNATGAAKRAEVVGLGSEFGKVLDSMFDIPAAATDFTSRIGSAGSMSNMKAYFGTNLTFQMRSLTIGTVASLTGWHTLRHLENLHQSVNWAFGFGWLSWSVMSSIMDVAVTPGLKRNYLAQVKPHDMSEAQGIRAYVEGLFPKSELTLLMDNAGLRDDVREMMITMARKHYTESQAAQAFVEGRIGDATFQQAMDRQAVEPSIRGTLVDMHEQNLATSDLKWLYANGKLTHEQIVQNLRWQGYREERAELKAQVIEAETATPKRDREVEALRHLYRDCVIDEIEFRQEMNNRSTASVEQEHQVTLALIERRQRTFLGNADLAKAAALGLRSVPEITNQLICRGYTQDDALTEVILRLAALLPSCEGKSLKEAELVTVLSALAQTLGANPIGVSAAISSFLSCLLPASGIAAPIITKFKATPEVVGFDGYSLLEWDVIGASTVTISHIGEVPSKGSTLYNLKEPIGFVLTAKNPFGTATESAFVKVDIDMSPPILPILSTITPATGPEKGGTVVVLTGSGFTGAVGANFGFVSGTGLQVDSDTQITVKTPPGSGEVDVRVLGSGGMSATGQGLTFTYA